MPRHCYALQHHAVAVQCLSSPITAMLLPRETMRFHAYPLLLCAFRGFSFAFIAYLSLRYEPWCHALPLLRQAVRGCATPLLFIASQRKALPSHLFENFVGESSLSGVPPLADASEPSVIQPFQDDILVRFFI